MRHEHFGSQDKTTIQHLGCMARALFGFCAIAIAHTAVIIACRVAAPAVPVRHLFPAPDNSNSLLSPCASPPHTRPDSNNAPSSPCLVHWKSWRRTQVVASKTSPRDTAYSAPLPSRFYHVTVLCTVSPVHPQSFISLAATAADSVAPTSKHAL